MNDAEFLRDMANFFVNPSDNHRLKKIADRLEATQFVQAIGPVERLEVASRILAGIAQSPVMAKYNDNTWEQLANQAKAGADALIEALNEH